MERAEGGFAPRRVGEPGDKRADTWLSPSTACFPAQVSASLS